MDADELKRRMDADPELAERVRKLAYADPHSFVILRHPDGRKEYIAIDGKNIDHIVQTAKYEQDYFWKQDGQRRKAFNFGILELENFHEEVKEILK
jgi:hypothetical protein